MGPKPNYFIAIDLSSEIKKQLHDLSTRLKSEFSFRKWVHPQDYHLTLKFFGPCTEKQLEDIKERLEHMTGTISLTSFSLRLERLSYFGQARTPRILWAGVAGELDQLHQVYKQVEMEMTAIGFPSEQRPYRPHVTLAKNFRGKQDPSAELSDLWNSEFQTSSWEVRQIHLFRTDISKLPMYSIVETFSI